YSWTPGAFTVEEVDAVDYTIHALQIDGPRLAAGSNVFANFHLFTGSVSVFNHYAMELNRAARDSKLNAPKCALGSAYHNCVAIPLTVNCGLSEQNPLNPLNPLSERCLTDAHQQ